MIYNRHTYRAQAEEGADLGGDDTAVADPPEVEKEDPALLAEAKRMGWTPKDEFRGDPEKWRPASEFVERGRNMLPIVQATVKKQANEIAELKASMKQMGEYFTKAEQRSYEKAMADLKAQRAQAIKDGDGEAFAQVDDAIDGLKKDMEAKAPPKAESSEDPVYEEWADENKRWLADEELEEFATFKANSLRKNGEKATGRKFLDLVTDAVKKRFPEKFENPRRQAAPAVEGATSLRKGGKGFADLPAEARAACERMARNGFPDDPAGQKKFKEDYLRNYEW